MSSSDCAVVIPARLESSRFPAKPLAMIDGIPLIIRVATRAAEALGRDHVFVATDSSEILDVVEQFGFRALITPEKCLTGCDRVADAVSKIPSSYDYIVNVQGDEPLVDPQDIVKCCVAAKQEFMNKGTCIVNAYAESCRGSGSAGLIPTVVISGNKTLLYASRARLPYNKLGEPSDNFKKQVCIYVFDRFSLLDLYGANRVKAQLEFMEDVEILRAVERGREVRMVEVSGSGHAVDYPEDVAIVEKILRSA